MPSFRRRASVVDADGVAPQPEPDQSADAADALALAEEAEAEAAEADAVAAAARARARAIKLRRQAQTVAEAKSTATAEAASTATEVESATIEDGAEEPAEPIEATADSADDEPQESADEEEPGRRRLRLRLRRGPVLKALAATIAIACTAALITLSVLMVISHRHQAAEAQRRAEFAAAGRQSVVTLMSLDFNKAKDDVQRIIDNSTGQFHDDFKNQADDFIKVAQDSKVITEVNVNAAAVEQMTDDSATVLVSATSRVSNAAGAKQEPRSWRLSVVLQRDGGQLKMARVEFVP